jgi:hypothetical protein
MNRIIIVGFLGLWGFALFQLVACTPMKGVNAGDSALAIVDISAVSPDIVAGPSCASPTPQMIAGCQAQAERILASTVRLEFHGPSGGIGHGTVFGGRYLITHNHYPVSGEVLSHTGDDLISAVSVFKANGDIVLLKAPLSYFDVVGVAPEALVLDFKEYNGIGFFDRVGVLSIETKVWNDLTIQPGEEVAQIDWDGTTARVIWILVAAVRTDSGTPYVEVDYFVEQGASGGGVFYNGIHIANNWSRLTDRDPVSGEDLRQYSVAAMNTESLLGATSGANGVAVVGN